MGALLFVLVHLRDGVIQAGQRDYAIAAIVLLALVLVLRGPFARLPAAWWAFGFLVGCTMTIKPTMLLLLLLPIYVSFLQEQTPTETAKKFCGVFVAFLLPIAGMFLWLHRWHAIPAFLHSMQLARRSHSGLAHKTIAFLLIHSIQPVAIFFLLGIMLLALRHFKLDTESKILLFAAAAGLGSFILQGKGFPYQRYPFLALIIIVIARLVADELETQPLNRAVAIAILAVACLWWAPRFALSIAKYDHADPFEETLEADLTTLHAGDGDVQCLDTVGGCVNVLYDQHLVQSTGYLYDCYAYAGPADEQAAYRQSFLAALETARPRYIVLTSEFCLNAQGWSGRIDEWPALHDYLSQNYASTASWRASQQLHWWHQPETPPSFEIFGRK
jgi:hypothetical protein